MTITALTDLIAEKFRSLLQQETRNRYRRQDVYDLNLLICTLDEIDVEEKVKILDCIIKKSHARAIYPTIRSFAEPELKRRAEKDYSTLNDEIEGELPDFEQIFNTVSNFYSSLPWDSLPETNSVILP